jgi:methyl-accepting chemotaxis protein
MPAVPRSEVIRKQLYNLQTYAGPAVVPYGYVVGLLLGLRSDEALFAILAIAVPIGILAGLAGPVWLLPKALREAEAVIPGEPPGARLTRILELPRRLEVMTLLGSVLGVMAFAIIACAHFGKPYESLGSVFLATLAFRLFVAIPQHVASEKILLPLAVEEFHRHPGHRPSGEPFYWPRQSWFLPYAFGVTLVCGLGTVITIIVRKSATARDATLELLTKRGDGALAGELRARMDALVADTVLPLLVVGVFFLVLAGLTAWLLARRQHEGAKALEKSIQVIAGGSSALPDWVATDELGDLAFGLGGIYEKLEAVAQLLQRSAQRLAVSGEELTRSGRKQNDTVTRQAASLQEARITAEEIRQTSQLASRQSEEVLAHAERAESIRTAGEQAIDESLGGLEDIRSQVTDMAAKIRMLGERATQVASITSTVKDLADQSNMLALNAAIEAVRSGEHGKGFSVVAREIRTLADQSIQATTRVRSILHDNSDALSAAVVMSQQGQQRVEVAVVQMRTSGDRLRQLAEIVHQNLDAVRQISAAVSQQNAGISQVTEAVGELSHMMDETLDALKSTEDAAGQVQAVGREVSAAMGAYGQPEAAPAAAIARAA